MGKSHRADRSRLGCVYVAGYGDLLSGILRRRAGYEDQNQGDYALTMHTGITPALASRFHTTRNGPKQSSVRDAGPAAFSIRQQGS